MIVISELRNVRIIEPSGFRSLSITDKNYVHDNLIKGNLLFKYPEKYEDMTDKNEINSYKAGFLDELLIEVYGEGMTLKQRHEVISKKYYMFNTLRRHMTFLKLYKSN